MVRGLKGLSHSHAAVRKKEEGATSLLASDSEKVILANVSDALQDLRPLSDDLRAQQVLQQGRVSARLLESIL
jgi:hypothetical protein